LEPKITTWSRGLAILAMEWSHDMASSIHDKLLVHIMSMIFKVDFGETMSGSAADQRHVTTLNRKLDFERRNRRT
jgi:hypothetical protein